MLCSINPAVDGCTFDLAGTLLSIKNQYSPVPVAWAFGAVNALANNAMAIAANPKIFLFIVRECFIDQKHSENCSEIDFDLVFV